MEAAQIKKLDKTTVASYVSKIVSEHYDSTVSEVKCLGGGSYGIAYKVTQSKYPQVLTLKVCKVDGMHKKEAYDLTTLAQHTRMKYPQVYFTRDSTKEIPIDCICMEFIEGKNAFANYKLLFMAKKKKRILAEQIIDSMLEIHSFTNPKFGAIESPSYDSWMEYYRPFAIDILQSARKLRDEKKLDTYIVDTMEEAFKKFDEIFIEEVKKASLIHGDLNVANVMVKNSIEVAAIIDPLESKFADREYDLFQLNNLTGKKFNLYNLYKEKYPVSKNCDVKCAFYGLWNEVYCYIKSGALFNFIMKPLVKDMKKQLKSL